MAKKGKQRVKEAEMELDLTPMMNLISILIPVLLVSAAFVEVAVINVAAPAIGGAASAEDKPKDKPDKPPLNLTLTVTDQGYILAGSGAVLPGAQGEGPTFPLVQKPVSCRVYVGTWPAPRVKNRSLPRCDSNEQTYQYWVYDNAALTVKLAEIKEAFPDETRIIIAAEPGIEYEAITEAMDASRQFKDPGGDVRILFEEVVLSPGMS